MKPRVFVTRQIFPTALARLAEVADLTIWQAVEPPSHSVLMDQAACSHAFLTLLTDPIDEQVIQQAGPQWMAISQMAVGIDNISIPAATRRNIPVGHTPGVLTETTADFTWSLLMACSRRIVEAHNEVHQGIWRPWGPDVLTGYDIFGATLGIIGFGRIGQAIARRAKGFGMNILYTDPHRQPEAEQETGAHFSDLNTLLRQSDFVTLHTYLSPETRGLINADRIALMKPTSILINTARGPIVDQQALAQALVEGRIAGAALDVTDPEPISASSPLLTLPNLIITPHIASASKATREKMALIAVENLLSALRGERMQFCANPEVYR